MSVGWIGYGYGWMWRYLHFGDLLVNVLHELDDKVDELVLEVRLNVCIGQQKANVIALPTEH